MENSRDVSSSIHENPQTPSSGPPTTDDEDLSLGYAYMRALVEEYDKGHRLAEGVYYFEKPEPGKWI
jgi:hypothetical protein